MRLPFRFGVVTLREAPQVFVRCQVMLDEGGMGTGVEPDWKNMKEMGA